MAIKKMYLKNGIVVYEGTTFEFTKAAKFGCICDECNRIMIKSFYYPVLGRAYCLECHERTRAFHEPKSFHPDDAKYQKWKSLLFEYQLKQAGFEIEEEESNDSKN